MENKTNDPENMGKSFSSLKYSARTLEVDKTIT